MDNFFCGLGYEVLGWFWWGGDYWEIWFYYWFLEGDVGFWVGLWLVFLCFDGWVGCVSEFFGLDFVRFILFIYCLFF